jgi:hypothetical protein
MENKETSTFSHDVKELIETIEQNLREEEELEKNRYLIRLGLYTKDPNGIKRAKYVTDEEYQVILKYKHVVYESEERFSGLLKMTGSFFLTAGIIGGIIGIFSGATALLLFITLPGFILYLILYGLGIVVKNSYKIK